MQTSLKSARRRRTIGSVAGVIVVAATALLSGCYYRRGPPEYGGRGYRAPADRDHDRDHRHDRDGDHERHY
jgi:hypothetical protein